MRAPIVAAALFVSLLLAGCVSPAEREAADRARVAANTQDIADARAHKITFVEAARRINSRISIEGTGSLAPTILVSMQHRLALYSEVDAGRLTLEMADYQISASTLQMAQAQQQQDNQEAAIRQAALAAAQRNTIHCETQRGIGLVVSETNCQ